MTITYPRKILISGTFSTGKTGLCSSLSDILSTNHVSNIVLTEIARVCPFPLNEEQTMLSTMWMFANQLSNEMIEMKNKVAYVIMDRSLPDIIAHARCIKLSQSESEVLKSLERQASLWCSTFDFIFMTRANDQYGVTPDGLRSLSTSLQHTVQKNMSDFFTSNHIDHHILPDGIEARLDFILKHMKIKHIR